jgi:hypothetical protein
MTLNSSIADLRGIGITFWAISDGEFFDNFCEGLDAQPNKKVVVHNVSIRRNNCIGVRTPYLKRPLSWETGGSRIQKAYF